MPPIIVDRYNQGILCDYMLSLCSQIYQIFTFIRFPEQLSQLTRGWLVPLTSKYQLPPVVYAPSFSPLPNAHSPLQTISLMHIVHVPAGDRWPGRRASNPACQLIAGRPCVEIEIERERWAASGGACLPTGRRPRTESRWDRLGGALRPCRVVGWVGDHRQVSCVVDLAAGWVKLSWWCWPVVGGVLPGGDVGNSGRWWAMVKYAVVTYGRVTCWSLG